MWSKANGGLVYLVSMKIYFSFPDRIVCMIRKWLVLIFGNFSPAFGKSSDEGSEAIPGNRVYLTWAGAWKINRCKINRSDILFGLD